MFDFIHKVNYHQNPHTLHIGCESPPRVLCPLSQRDGGAGRKPCRQPRLSDPVRDWDFTFYPSLRDVPDITAPGSVPGRTDRIEVPRSWETPPGIGITTRRSTVNAPYPVTVDPPFCAGRQPLRICTAAPSPCPPPG